MQEKCVSCFEMRMLLFFGILFSVSDELWAAQVCCSGLGCYSNDQPFSHLPLPQCPEDMDVQMTVYTRQDPTTGQTITRNTIPSTFKDNVTTMFIVHGWMQVLLISWMTDIKNAALEQGDYNVVIVTWRGAMSHALYDLSSSNTRTVGGEIALVANNTIKKGKSSKDLIYCVGHSLGAHVCGHAGRQGGSFGRITGLDPAGPLFEGYDPSVGLSPSCADLVDNIHTNGELIPTIGSGMMKARGHIDFYPNGGRSQPGCLTNQYRKMIPILTDFVTCDDKVEVCVPNVETFQTGCSHNRAIYLFTESIRSPCFLSHFSCTAPEEIPDSCTQSKDAVQSMGFSANKYPGRGIFYLKTKACAPFCCK